MHVLAHDEPETAGERGLEGRDVDLSVALPRVPVTDLEQRTGSPHGDVERRARDELLVIEIAGVNARWRAADPSHGAGWRVADAPEKGTQRQLDSGGEVRDHLLLVERNDLGARVVVVFGEPAAPRAETIVRVRDREVDRLDLHLEHIARIRAADIDRPGENVSAGTAVLDGIVDRAQRLLYIVRRHAHLFQPARARGDEGADDHLVAGLDAKHRSRRGVVVAESDGARRRHECIHVRRRWRHRWCRAARRLTACYGGDRDQYREYATHGLVQLTVESGNTLKGNVGAELGAMGDRAAPRRVRSCHSLGGPHGSHARSAGRVRGVATQQYVECRPAG